MATTPKAGETGETEAAFLKWGGPYSDRELVSMLSIEKNRYNVRRTPYSAHAAG